MPNLFHQRICTKEEEFTTTMYYFNQRERCDVNDHLNRPHKTHSSYSKAFRCLYLSPLPYLLMLVFHSKAFMKICYDLVLYTNSLLKWIVLFFCLLLCRYCVVIDFILSSPQQPMTPDIKDYHPKFIHYYFCPIIILEKNPVFPFSCSVLHKGTLLVPFL